MDLCCRKMGNYDFVSWFTDSGYPTYKNITNKGQQEDVARQLIKVCEKRE